MIYLDNSATTQVSLGASEIAQKYMTQQYFNPSSAYNAAVNVERDVKEAREKIAHSLFCTPDEIIFTSGGTESNNAAIIGTALKARNKGRIICSRVEHPSVYEVFSLLQGMGFEWVVADVDSEGRVDKDSFSALVTDNTIMASIMHVNNETGAINDLHALRQILAKGAPNALFHSDGVQAYCKLPFARPTANMYSVSGHKLHAPKGIGFLYVEKGTRFFGSLVGGGQERGLRSGTTNVPGIMALAYAVADYMENQTKYIDNMRNCKKLLHDNLMSIPDVLTNGDASNNTAPHILNMSFLGVRGEVLLHTLAEKKIYVSTGSACSTHKKGNRILEAMGIKGERQEGAIRFSLCANTTSADINTACEVIKESVYSLRKFRRR